MERRGGWNKGLVSSRTQEIIDLRRSGKTMNQIAVEVGVSKSYCCKLLNSVGLGGPAIEQRLTESQVADYVSKSGFDYVSGYQMAKKPITVRCRDCGRTFERQFHIFRDVVNGTWKNKNECPLCRDDRQAIAKETREQEKEEQRKQRQAEAEREAQKRAQLKAERLSRAVNEQLTKRLAIHTCKNCGKDFCQMTTGYNSTAYCSEKCQKRWYNRKACDKRHKKLMSREHDTDISLEKLYQRDRGICYLCGGVCDWSDGEERDGTFIAGPMYPSVDHVVPVAKGGTHTWANIKLAHRDCNTKKRDQIQSPSVPNEF